jgi:ATP-dependent DNA ligase
VRLYSRPGNDLTNRFPLIVEALARLRAGSCIVDGEAVVCGDDGIASFERLRDWRHGDSVFLYAFNLIELNGDDLRREPLAVRKATLASLVARASPGLLLAAKFSQRKPDSCRMTRQLALRLYPRDVRLDRHASISQVWAAMASDFWAKRSWPCIAAAAG